MKTSPSPLLPVPETPSETNNGGSKKRAYKITIPVTLIVEIDDSNIEAGTRPALHGNTAIVAVRRAIFCLLGSPVSLRKELGTRGIFISGKWEAFPVETLDPEARYTAAPAQNDSLSRGVAPQVLENESTKSNDE